MSGDDLIVVVTIEAGDSFAGSLRTDPDRPGLAFSGWLSFIEAIEVLRRRSRDRESGKSPDADGGTTIELPDGGSR